MAACRSVCRRLPCYTNLTALRPGSGVASLGRRAFTHDSRASVSATLASPGHVCTRAPSALPRASKVGPAGYGARSWRLQCAGVSLGSVRHLRTAGACHSGDSGSAYKSPMLDYKAVRSHLDTHVKNVADRNVDADPKAVVALYEQYVALSQQHEELLRSRNQLSRQGLPPDEMRELGRELKQTAARLDAEVAACRARLEEEGLKLPVLSHEGTPVGDESAAIALRTIGDMPQFDFEPKGHLEIGEHLDMFDFKGAAGVAGGKFVILRNDAAMLELALVHWALTKATEAGFTPVLAPDVAHSAVVAGCGFRPRDEAQEASQVYGIVDSDLCLVGTSEISLAGMFADHMFQETDLPVKSAAFGHCFRREAGAGGQASKGLYRLHQFSKVELFVHASEAQSHGVFDELVGLQESIFQGLGLHCRVLEMPTRELGMAAHRKIDIEAWMPARQAYGEVSSASHCLDYQSRRLHTRYKTAPSKGKRSSNHFVHTLNATALAVPRIILTILETYQQADGSVIIPEVLRPLMGGRVVMEPPARSRVSP